MYRLRRVSNANFLTIVEIIMNYNSWIWLFKLWNCISHRFSLFAFRHFHSYLSVKVFGYFGILEAFGVVKGSQLHYVSLTRSVESFDNQRNLFSNIITCFKHLEVSVMFQISLFMLFPLRFRCIFHRTFSIALFAVFSRSFIGTFVSWVESLYFDLFHFSICRQFTLIVDFFKDLLKLLWIQSTGQTFDFIRRRLVIWFIHFFVNGTGEESWVDEGDLGLVHAFICVFFDLQWRR